MLKEVLTSAGSFVVVNPTKSSDVYSYGMIAYETFNETDPYEHILNSVDKHLYRTPHQLLLDIKSGGLQSAQYSELTMKLSLIGSLISSAWDIIPERRPSCSEILKQIKTANPGSRSILDAMMIAVEKYAVSLEDKVLERTRELEKITKSLENLLNNMLPPKLADKLARGEPIEPEYYEGSTVFFSDVVGFTTLAAVHTPLEVIKLLNDLYSGNCCSALNASWETCNVF